jgi:glycosyltransferase 2 family protein
MNSRRGQIAWILLGVALLAWLIYESGPSRIASDLALIGAGLAVVVLLEFVVDGFNTVGWWFTFPRDLRGGSFGKLFFVRLAGTALNATLPAASMGGEPAKVYLLHGDFPVATVVATVMTSSLIFSLSKAIFIAWGLLLTWRHIELSHQFSLAVLVGFLTTLACVLAFLFLQLRGFTDMASQILRRLPIPKRWMVRLRRLSPAVDAEMAALYRSRPRDLVLALCSHQVAFLCGVLQVLFLLRRLGLPHSFSISLAVESLVMLLGFVTFIVPSVLGVQEGAKLLIFTALGLPAAAGLTVGIAFRLTSIVDNGAGLLALAALKGRKKASVVATRSWVTSD